MHSLSNTRVKQAVARFPARCNNLTGHRKMMQNNLPFWFCDFFNVTNTVGSLVFGEEEIAAQVAVAGFKIVSKVGMPARGYRLKEDGLRRSGNL